MWTLDRLIEDNMTVTAYCRCGRHRVLDPAAMRERVGNIDAMASDLAPRLTCDGCGASHPDLIYAPDDAKVFGMGKATNAYAAAKGRQKLHSDGPKTEQKCQNLNPNQKGFGNSGKLFNDFGCLSQAWCPGAEYTN